MKALTLHQPWASLIALGVKTIETRTWDTRYRGTLAIHAGASIPSYLGLGRRGRLAIGEYEIEKDGPGQMLLRGPIAWPYRLPFGAVVAVVDLVDVVSIEIGFPSVHEHDGSPNLAQRDHPREHLGLWYCTHDDDHYGGRASKLIEDQRPYGNFDRGRFAWILGNVRPIRHPVAAIGERGLWSLDRPTLDLVLEQAP